MATPLERLRRWHADRYNRPLYGGDADPTIREMLLEFYEQRIVAEERDKESNPLPVDWDELEGGCIEDIADPVARWEAAERKLREMDEPYVPRLTGDPVVDEWERRIALGLNPYED